MLYRNTAGYIDASMVVITSGAALVAGTVYTFVQRTSDSKWLWADGSWNVTKPTTTDISTMTHVSGGGWNLAHTPADADDTYFINCIDSGATCYPDNYTLSILLPGAKEATLAALPGNLSNQIEDDIVRDANGLKISSIIYVYDTAINATAHDKVTGIIGKYAITVTYTSQRMATFKSVRVI